jgi:hypothetical protein
MILSSGVGFMTVIDLTDDLRRSDMKSSFVMTSTFDLIMKFPLFSQIPFPPREAHLGYHMWYLLRRQGLYIDVFAQKGAKEKTGIGYLYI